MNSYEETTTAKEHMAWCKKRALAHLDRNSEYYSIQEAVTSMMSDLGKHPDTAKIIAPPSPLGMVGIKVIMDNSHGGAEKWIKGFADF